MAAREVACPTCGTRNRTPVVAKGRPRCGKCHAELPWLVDVTTGEFDQMIEQSGLPVLIDVWAPWCGPCRMVAPMLEQLVVERAGTVRVAKVNADEEPALSSRLRAQSIPMLVLFDKGTEIARQVGAVPARQLNQWLDESLAARRS